MRSIIASVSDLCFFGLPFFKTAPPLDHRFGGRLVGIRLTVGIRFFTLHY